MAVVVIVMQVFVAAVLVVRLQWVNLAGASFSQRAFLTRNHSNYRRRSRNRTLSRNWVNNHNEQNHTSRNHTVSDNRPKDHNHQKHMIRNRTVSDNRFKNQSHQNHTSHLELIHYVANHKHSEIGRRACLKDLRHGFEPSRGCLQQCAIWSETPGELEACVAESSTKSDSMVVRDLHLCRRQVFETAPAAQLQNETRLWFSSVAFQNIREDLCLCWQGGRSLPAPFKGMDPHTFLAAWRGRRVLFIGNYVTRELAATIQALHLRSVKVHFGTNKVGETYVSHPFKRLAQNHGVFFAYVWRTEPDDIKALSSHVANKSNISDTATNPYMDYIAFYVAMLINDYGPGPVDIIWNGYGGQCSASQTYGCAYCRERVMQDAIMDGAAKFCRIHGCRFHLMTDPPVGNMWVGTHCNINTCVREAKQLSDSGLKICSAPCLWPFQLRFWASFKSSADAKGQRNVTSFLDLWDTGMRQHRTDHIHLDRMGNIMLALQLTHHLVVHSPGKIPI